MTLIFRTECKNSQEIAGAVRSWLLQSLYSKMPTQSKVIDKLNLDQDRLEDLTIGAWRIEVGNRHNKDPQWGEELFQAIIAARPAKNLNGSRAHTALNQTIIGPAVRMIVMGNNLRSPSFGIVMRSDRFYLFDPTEGLFAVSRLDARKFFTEHMKKHHKGDDQNTFYVKDLIPVCRISWYKSTSLDEWFEKDTINVKDSNQLSEVTKEIAKILGDGNVAIGENHIAPHAKYVLSQLLKMEPCPVKAIFLENGSPKSFEELTYKESNQEQLAENFATSLLAGRLRSNSNHWSVELCREMAKNCFKNSVSVYKSDPRRAERQENGKEAQFTIERVGHFETLPGSYRSIDEKSPEALARRNRNMARIFSKFSSSSGCITFGGSNHLIPSGGNKIENKADFLQFLCRITHVFDFSGYDHSNQEFPGLIQTGR